MIPIANRLADVQEYYFSQKLREIEAMKKEGKKVLNLGIGSPDLPPHPSVIEKLHAESALPDSHAYQSYRGAPALRQAMADLYAKWYNVTLNPETELLPLMGSKEGITHICMTYLNEGDAALVPNPGYPAYASAVKVAGATVLLFPLTETNQYFPDIKQLTNMVKEHGRVKLMFINYPHMPTGQLPTRQMFNELVIWAKDNGVLLIHDNPYSFILNETPMSLLASPGAMEVSLELNSLSKSHNLAGWRVGLLAGKPERLQEVLRFKSNLDSGMFLPLQLAAAKALLLDADWFTYLNNHYRNRRKLVFEILDILKCPYSENQAGMFVWAGLPVGYKDGYDLSDTILHNAHVFITPGGIFGSEGNLFIRISLCSNESVLQEAIQRIQSIQKKI